MGRYDAVASKKKRLSGHPPLYSTPEDLQVAIDNYFSTTVDEKITITGLVLALGFCNRASFYDQENRKGFSDTIKTARTRIENSYEACIKGRNPVGPIFALKNFGWSDKQEIDQNINANVKGSIKVTYVKKALDASDK